MSSNVLKTIVMKDRVLFGPDRYCATEVLNHADVVTVNPRGYIYEFEIKVSKSDLKGELDAMQYWLENNRLQTSIVDEVVSLSKIGNTEAARKMLYSEKWKKHHSYLVSETKRYRRPRVFYFVVTPALEEYALSRLENSPYGLYVAHQTEKNGYMYNKKKATPLSNNKMDDRDRADIMQRIQTENIVMKMDRYLNKKWQATDPASEHPTPAEASPKAPQEQENTNE